MVDYNKSDMLLFKLFLTFVMGIGLFCGYLCYTCSDWKVPARKTPVTQPEPLGQSRGLFADAWKAVDVAEEFMLDNLELLQAIWNYLIEQFVDDPDLRDLLQLGEELKRDFENADELKKHIYKVKSKEMLERLLERSPKIEHGKGKTYF